MWILTWIFQYVDAARKNNTSIHADALNANDENQRGNRKPITNPRIVPERENSNPHSSTLKSRDAIGLTNCTYARATQASNAAAVGNRIANTLETR
jgi:hypothetical protein